MAHAFQVLAAQLLCPLGVQRKLENGWTSSLVICGPHRFLWSCDTPTTESLPPLLVSKMPKTLATAVLPPNGLSKDGMILQQFRCIPKEPQECKSSQDLPHSSIVTVAATIVVHKLLLSSSPGASESAACCEIRTWILEQFLQQRVFHLCGIGVSLRIPLKVNAHAHIVYDVIEFGVGWDVIYCIPISTSFQTQT